MSSRWMRSIVYDYSGAGTSPTNTGFWRKAFTLWLRYVMDFTVQVDSCGAGRSWVSTEKNGTGGAFGGSNYEFTDASAPFVFGDLNKYLIVKDSTNPATGGIYRIIKYVSATTVIIDFAAGYAEYPVAASGLSWWVCGYNYQIPAETDYCRLQSRHASGWAIEWVYGGWAYYQQSVRIAPNGNWASKIIGTFSGSITGDSRYYTGLTTTWSNGSGRQTFWAEGDYDGNWLHLWMHDQDSGGWNQSNNIGLISVEMITPVSEGHSADELIVLRGGVANIHAVDRGDRQYHGDYARGRSWSDLYSEEVTGYLLDYTLSGYGNNFSRTYFTPQARECNYRRDGKLEAFLGSYYVIDENNYNGKFHILGYLNGHISIPLLATFPNSDLRHDLPNRAVHKMMPMSLYSDRDKICILDGIVIPWCGLSVRGAGR